MDRNKIIQLFTKLKLKVSIITFLEEGYEILVIGDDDVDFDTISNMKIDGFSIVGIIKRNNTYRVLIVPISLEEMTDYIWRYVEKFGNKGEKLINILGDAVCALERAIESIQSELANQKEEAVSNFEKFTSQIF